MQLKKRKCQKRLCGEGLEERRVLSATVFEHNDIGYFVAADASRIDRYSIDSETWLTPIELQGASETAIAAHVDDDGIYVSYGNAVYRYDLSGGNQQHLLNANDPVHAIHSDGNLLFLNHTRSSYARFISVDKTTNTIIDTIDDYLDTVYGSSIDQSVNRIFGRTQGSSPSDITYVSYDDAGNFTGNRDSNYHGDYPGATRTWTFPGGGKVVDTSGTIYSTDGLVRLASFSSGVNDIDFAGDEVPIVLSGSTLTAYNAFILPTGSTDLGYAPSDIFVNDTNVIVFTSDSNAATGYVANLVPLDDLDAPTPGDAVDPEGVPYTPDELVVANDGTVLIFSQSLQSVFRWDPVTQSYSEAIPLIGTPQFMSYSAESHVIYLAYDSGLIRSIDLAGTDRSEVPFATLPSRPLGLATAGVYVFAVDASGAWDSHYTFGPDGSQISAVEWNYYSTEYIWSDANQKMYFFRDDTSPNDLLWEQINADGVTYAGLSPGQIGSKDDSPLHSSSGFTHPIRVSPDGTTVVLGSGRIHDAETLERSPTGLSNSISDAAWLNGELYTIRSVAGVSQYQKWDSTTYSQVDVRQGSNAPHALLAIENHDRLVGININSDGVPEFDVMNDALVDIPNPVPVATITSDDVSVLVDTSVALDASTSFDPDGSPAPITFQWSIVSGPGSGTFSAPNAAITNFTPDGVGEYVIQISVSDSEYTGTDTLVVTARTNESPVADASGSETSAIVGSGTVTLDALSSADADGDSLTYLWEVIGAPEGSAPSILNETQPLADLDADVAGTYEVQVTVSDGFASDTDTVTIDIRANASPVADTSLSETFIIVGAGGLQLDGSLSADSDGDALSYSWSVADAPDGSSNAGIFNGLSPLATFDPDVAGLYVIDLVVSDGILSGSQSLIVTVRENSAPVADATLSAVNAVANGWPVALDASATADADGDDIFYQWQIVQSPLGSSPVIADGANAITTFTTDKDGDYRVELTVSDGILTSTTTVDLVVTINQRPVADASLSDILVDTGATARFDAGQSYDPDGDPMTYMWELSAAPGGSTARIEFADEAVASFTPMTPGLYAIRLTVDDGLESTSDTFILTVAAGTNQTPVADPSLSQTQVLVGESAALDATRSSDPDGDTLSYLWTVVESPVGSSHSIADTMAATTTFSSDTAGEYQVRLEVSDGAASISKAITIHVVDENNLQPWYNPVNPTDVNDDNIVTPLDVLMVINELNQRQYSDQQTGALIATNPTDSYLDVDGNNILSPSDALIVINALSIQEAAAASQVVVHSGHEATPFIDFFNDLSITDQKDVDSSRFDRNSLIDEIWAAE